MHGRLRLWVIALALAAAHPAWALDEIPAVQESDALYETRDVPGNIERLLQLLRSAAAAHPNSYDVQWRLARALQWAAEGLSDKERHEVVAQEGYEAARRAVALRPDGAEGLYFGALNVAEIGLVVGLFRAFTMGLQPKFEEPMFKAERLNPLVDNAGPSCALGRYYYALPWPKRDLDRSIQYLRRSLELFPANVRTQVYLAEALYDRHHENEREEAARLLKGVLNAPAGRYDRAEELRVKGYARAAMERLGISP